MLGILTCKAIPQLPEDDLKFVALLEDAGLPYRIFVWDEVSPKDLHVQTLLIRSTWDYHLKTEKYLSFLKECAELGIQVLNSYEIVKWNYSKKYLLDLKEKNIPIVDSLFFSSQEEFKKLKNDILNLGWTDVVVKPVISASAHLTCRTTPSHPDFEKYALEILKAGDGIVQPYISSIATDGEISLLFFNAGGPRFSHAVVKRPKTQDFRVQMEFGGSTELLVPEQDLIDLGLKILNTVSGNWLYARVDIVDWKVRPQLGELEMIEPSLFFSYDSAAPQRFVAALKNVF